jgi:LDH2 family malate/lactate/ureidoglycolate dehydrogenase
MTTRYAASDLTAFAGALMAKAGLDPDKAGVVAEVLVEGDLLGHTTHGLHLLPLYLDELAHRRMAYSGAPETLADRPAAVTWDGRRLPGPWLVMKALDLALARAQVNGTCTVVIRRSHHIACLAAYLRRATDKGMMVILTCSDPHMAAVAPHGGRRGVYTPNPIAAGWPTGGDPVMIDTSMSIASHGLTRRHFTEKRRLPGAWLLDAEGRPTDDPAVLFAQPPGALLPIGGVDHGHKGYALGLLVEALTGGLAGHGRADPVEGWSSNVSVQVLDPAAFAGRDDFIRQAGWLARACRETPPRPGIDRVRLPGETGLRRRTEQLRHGIDLHAGILPALAPWAGRYGVPPPRSLAR